ncbi:WS/DGAT/MGAT family O-acyltransferase [Sansalvadorimonas verongulae]|uniref:WS/DGAT/MGAT family O-acyltransferase n=1 Tax=Sansalvadorimonas verongulae TaxID=2172824 RepID=UPI0012BC345B|nr:wax ester/triacylglycerol synthase family O-acyltransferase [Sansalvadorimonas verongulae]MTI15030.1 wax ester/triacylglycerol synthase family O-acyltransferase [Sansalvadorimonas verongulae]
MEQLSALDNLFLNMETGTTPMHVGSLAIYDTSTVPEGELTFKAVMKNLEARLHKAPMMRYRHVPVALGIDYPYWIADPDFDIEFHVRHIALPKPGDWRQLCIQFARLHARPLDMNRPPWEMYVIEGIDNVDGVPEGGMAIVLKAHHALVDGASGMQLMAALHDLTPARSITKYSEPWIVDRVPNQIELISRAGWNGMRRIAKRGSVMTRYARPLLGGLSRCLTKTSTCNLMKAPRTRFNGKVSPHRVFEAMSFDLKLVKMVKNSQPKVTINDVMMAVVSGGLRRYLKRKGELPDESLTAMVPVNIDPTRNDQKGATQGNHLSFMFPRIFTSEADPLERLRAINKANRAAKRTREDLGGQELMDAASLMPSTVTNLLMRSAVKYKLAGHIKPLFNTIITNVPGPQFPVYHTGAKLQKFFGAGLSYDTAGLFHVIFSYNGVITISITCCRKMMPDPEMYMDCLKQSWKELLAAIPQSHPQEERMATTEE